LEFRIGTEKAKLDFLGAKLPDISLLKHQSFDCITDYVPLSSNEFLNPVRYYMTT
jgi:hypothetical protein